MTTTKKDSDSMIQSVVFDRFFVGTTKKQWTATTARAHFLILRNM